MVTLSIQDATNLAQQVLRQSDYHSLRKLVVEETVDGAILITGLVASFYQKQKAQELVRNVVPGIAVVNDIVVD